MKFYILLPIAAALLSSCVSIKPYEPAKQSATASLTYDIAPSTFFAPELWINSGYKERVDIQLATSRISHPKTIYMKLADSGVAREINTIEANRPLRLSFEHKMVQGLGKWPMMCATKPLQVTFKPGHHYQLKAKTVVNYRPSQFFKDVETFDASCQAQIVDIQTKEVIADSGMNKFK